MKGFMITIVLIIGVVFGKPLTSTPFDGCINDCTSYNDGCNTCGCSSGGATFCTLIFCEVPGTPFCRGCTEGFELNEDQTNNFGCSPIMTDSPTVSPVISSKKPKKKIETPRLIKKVDVCKKLCSKDTRGKPCIHNGLFDRTCFDGIDGKCPAGTTQCADIIPTPKPTLKPTSKPIKKDKKPEVTLSPTMTPTVSKAKEIKKPKMTTASPTLKPPSKKEICSKKCSKQTKSLPCVHNARDNDTCYSFINKKICPAGTTDCTSFKKGKNTKKESVVEEPSSSPTVSPFIKDDKKYYGY